MPNILKSVKVAFVTGLLIICIAEDQFAQPGSLDPSFNPLDNVGASPDKSVHAAVRQLDGKVIIVGDFMSVNGVPRNRIARLGANGDLDPTFFPAGPNATIDAIIIQPDGKFIISGNFTLFDGSPRNRIARLNENGQLDPSFDPGTGFNGNIYSMVLQPDGKIISAGSFSMYNGATRNRIVRINDNGSLDGSFDPGSGASGVIVTLSLQADGKIVAGGNFTAYQGVPTARIVRINSDGSRDDSFIGGGTNSDVLSTAIQADGKILLGGAFTSYGGTGSAHLIVRLNTDGTRDLGFTPSVVSVSNTLNPSYVKSIQVLPDSKILIAGYFLGANGIVRKNIARLNPNGTGDATFTLQYYEFGATLSEVQQPATLVQPDGKILLLGGLRLVDSSGKPDYSFVPTIGSGANETVHSIRVQPDQRILVGGEFGRFNGATRNHIARLQVDGTLDQSFDPGNGADSAVFTTAIQPDGKIIIGGGFKTYSGTGRNRIARLNGDGSLDPLFDPGIGANGPVNVIALQPDGKVLIAGNFTSFNGTSRNRIARINNDGSLDTSFDPGAGANGVILTMAIQADGKIIIGGDFGSYATVWRSKLARLNSDGSLDTSFDVQNGFDFKVLATAIQPDGKILVGGYFFYFYSAKVARKITRLNTDGTQDPGFNPGGAGANAGLGFPLELFSYPEESFVNAIEVDANGKIIIGGKFIYFNGTVAGSLARLNTDGTVDTSFTFGGGNPAIRAFAAQDDQKIVIGGDFRRAFESRFITRIARVETKSDQIITFAALQAVCSGSTTTLGAFVSSGLPVSYSSSNPAIATINGNLLTAVGAGSVTITATQSGDASYNAATPVEQTLVVNAAPVATISPSGTVTICSGSTATLTAPSGYTYSWSTLETTQSIVVNNAGIFDVTVTNGSGCSATSQPTTITVSSPTVPTITPGGPTTFLSGGTVTLTSSPGASYLWSNGSTTQAIVVANPGAYSVTVFDQAGCGATSPPMSVTVIRPLSGGSKHTLLLINPSCGGTVMATGKNTDGQLADGTFFNRNSPVATLNLNEIVQVSSGTSHSLFLKNDGTVWASGLNSNGQLGDGTFLKRNAPVQVLSMTDVVQIQAAGTYSLFLKKDGTVWVCGSVLQPGGAVTNNNQPYHFNGLTDVKSFSGGFSHGLFLKNDGTVWASGFNTYGAFGVASPASSPSPILINNLNNVVAVACGTGFSLFLKNDGTVWGAGRNNAGQLGDGTITNKFTPVQVSGATGIVQIAAGESHSVLLKSDGSVLTMGLGTSGQLGYGNFASQTIPVVANLSVAIKYVEAGLNHSIFLGTNDLGYLCGNNSSGQLGNGTTQNQATPIEIINLDPCSSQSARSRSDSFDKFEPNPEEKLSSIYPNPADDKITVELPQPAQSRIRVQIFSQIGVTTNDTAFEPGEQSKSIDVKDLAAGIYFLQLKDGENTTRKKVIVVHK